MAKRGRPRKIVEGWFSTNADAGKMIKQLQAKVAKLTEERDEAVALAGDRFLSGQALAKQLVQAEDRIKDLLAEIRMYEHEHSTLRHIIIDALQGYK